LVLVIVAKTARTDERASRHHIIPLGEGEAHKPLATSWQQVSWTGKRLSAGRRAVRKAIHCLEAAADKS
jgi:hypothetical protein